MGIQITEEVADQIRLKKLLREEAALIEGDVEIDIIEAALEPDDDAGRVGLNERKVRRDRIRTHMQIEVDRINAKPTILVPS